MTLIDAIKNDPTLPVWLTISAFGFFLASFNLIDHVLSDKNEKEDENDPY